MYNKEKDLAKNTLILTIGKISTQAITFFLLPLYTAYLSREDYGIVDLISTIVFLLFPILNMQIEQAIFRYMVVNRNNNFKLKTIISSAFSFSFVQIAVFAVLFTLLQSFVNNEYKWFLLINLIPATLNFSLMQVLRGFGDNIGYSISAFISSFVNIGINLLLILVFNCGADAMLIASAIGNLVSVLFILIRTKFWNYYNPKFARRDELKELLSYSIPLIPNELSWWAIRTSDRFVITAALGTAANGILAIAHKFPNIFVMIYNILGLAWTESVVMHLKEADGERYFSDMTNRIFRIFSCLGLLIVAVLPFCFRYLVNDNFNQAYYLIPLYMIGSVFNVVIGVISTVYIANKQTKVIAKTSIIAALVCLLTNIILAKYIDIYSSPVSNIFGFGIMMIYRCIDIKRYTTVKWDRRFIIVLTIFTIINLLTYYIQITSLCLLSLIITCGFVLYTNRSDLGIVIQFCRKNLIKA